jgi:hypothetical protein
MSGQVMWEPKLQGETVLRYADFTDELASGESVTGYSASVSVWSGNDPSPSQIVKSVSLQNNTAGIAAVVAVSLQAGVLGTIYSLLIIATTSLANTIQKSATLAVRIPVN